MDKEKKLEVATRILSAMLSNPNVIVHNHRVGWSICNSNEQQLCEYAVGLAELLEEKIMRKPEKLKVNSTAKGYECEICQKPVPEHEPEYCCDGFFGDSPCGCMGKPIHPCVCSDKCYEALVSGVGKTAEERRINAGIGKFTS